MLPSPTRMSLPLNPTQCRLVPYPHAFAWHWHWRFPPAGRFVKHPTSKRLWRDKRIAHRVVCVADASAIFSNPCMKTRALDCVRRAMRIVCFRVQTVDEFILVLANNYRYHDAVAVNVCVVCHYERLTVSETPATVIV